MVVIIIDFDVTYTMVNYAIEEPCCLFIGFIILDWRDFLHFGGTCILLNQT